MKKVKGGTVKAVWNWYNLSGINSWGWEGNQIPEISGTSFVCSAKRSSRGGRDDQSKGKK